MSKYERLARMLKIITFIKSRPHLNRSELARLCEVDSVRTIQRDINSLVVAGIPVYWSGDGYEIMPDFFLPPMGLNIEEAFSLVLSAKAYADGEGEYHKSTIESAVAKIISTLSDSARELLEIRSNKIDVESRKASDAGGLISKLHQAIINRKQLRITYYSYNRNADSERIIDPYALMFRKHAWYLIGFCHTRRQVRIFRVNRIKSMSYTGETFSPPPDFSLEKYMDKSWQIMKGEETRVVVKFDADVAVLVKEVNWHPTQNIENLPDGSILFSATVSGIKEISLWILSYGYKAEVISPESLRKNIAVIAQKMYQRYRASEKQPLIQQAGSGKI